LFDNSWLELNACTDIALIFSFRSWHLAEQGTSRFCLLRSSGNVTWRHDLPFRAEEEVTVDSPPYTN
jgi:hypothetical protein